MNNNKPAEATMNFVKNLDANERFVLPGENTIYVCESRRTEGNRTSVTYRVEGSTDSTRFEFQKVNLSTVYILN